MSDVLEPYIEQEPDVRIVEGVVDVPPLLPVANEPARPEQAEVVRAGGLRKAGYRREIADAELARLEQRGDQPHPARIGENAERLGEVLEHTSSGSRSRTA